MKKNSILALAFAATLSLFASCAKEDNNPVEGQGKQITISAAFPENATKVVFVGSNEKDPVALKWEAGDQITVTATDNPTNTQTFTIASGVGTKQATFTGTALAAAASYKITYGTAGTYAEQTQAADGDASHVKYVATLSGVTDYTNFTFSKTWATDNGATYTPSSVLRLRAQIPNSDPNDFFGKIKAVVFKASAPIFAGSNELKVNITNSTDDAELDYLTIYATLPGEQEIAAGTTLLVGFQMDADKAYKKYTAYREFKTDMTIKAGQVNTIAIDCMNIFASAGKDDDGTAAHPYLIADQNQMDYIHSLLSTSTKKYFKMVDDVDMTGVAWTSLNNATGYNKEIDFDGNNKTISNLSSNSGAYPSFAGVAYGNYKNVTFDKANIDGGNNNIGVFAGYIGTVVSSENRNATVSGITVSNSTVVGTATQTNRNTGGFAGVVGVSGATITDCHVTGTTTVSQSGTTYYKGCCVGGFIGNVTLPATITGCTSHANIHNNLSYYTGGFIGQVGAAVKVEVSNCAFLGGTITAGRNSVDNSPVGGFIGRVTSGAGSTFTNCYVDGAQITATNSGRCGGFVGDGGDKATKNTYTSCYVKNSTVSGAKNCGGFAGTLYGAASKCYVESTTITANNDNNGGFAGYLENGTATNCYASATVIGGAHENNGGFVGNARKGDNVPGEITYCYTNSTVSGSAASVGAFIGGVTAVPNSVTKCIAWNGTQDFVGSAGSLDITTAITGNYTGTSGTISSQATTLGWDASVWDLSGSVPTLK